MRQQSDEIHWFNTGRHLCTGTYKGKIDSDSYEIRIGEAKNGDLQRRYLPYTQTFEDEIR